MRKGDKVFACEAPTPRTRKVEEIGKLIEEQKLKVDFKAESSVDQALEDATAAAGEGDIVLICGSLYILGDAMQYIARKESEVLKN